MSKYFTHFNLNIRPHCDETFHFSQNLQQYRSNILIRHFILFKIVCMYISPFIKRVPKMRNDSKMKSLIPFLIFFIAFSMFWKGKFTYCRRKFIPLRKTNLTGKKWICWPIMYSISVCWLEIAQIAAHTTKTNTYTKNILYLWISL